MNSVAMFSGLSCEIRENDYKIMLEFFKKGYKITEKNLGRNKTMLTMFLDGEEIRVTLIVSFFIFSVLSPILYINSYWFDNFKKSNKCCWEK